MEDHPASNSQGEENDREGVGQPDKKKDDGRKWLLMFGKDQSPDQIIKAIEDAHSGQDA